MSAEIAERRLLLGHLTRIISLLALHLPPKMQTSEQLCPLGRYVILTRLLLSPSYHCGPTLCHCQVRGTLPPGDTLSCRQLCPRNQLSLRQSRCSRKAVTNLLEA